MSRTPPSGTAVLLSGGLDSAVLLADEATRGRVYPVYISVGLAWEAAERATVDAFLAAWPSRGACAPLAVLSVDMRDVYAPSHWSMTGRAPGYHTPDEDVYLPGRNIVLLSKAGVYCASANLARLVMGTLAGNPFPDATPEFRSSLATALSLGLAHELAVDAPYASLGKGDVIGRGAALGVPMELTLSCMSPVPGAPNGGQHCGTCSKCRERHEAFVEVGVADPTVYVDRTFVGPPPHASRPPT